jgi:hypothetical protein
MKIIQNLEQYVDYIRAVYQQDFALADKLTQEGFIFESRTGAKILEQVLALFKILTPDTVTTLCPVDLGSLGQVMSLPAWYKNTLAFLEHSQYYRKLAEFQRAYRHHQRKSSPQTQSHSSKELTCTSIPLKNLD